MNQFDNEKKENDIMQLLKKHHVFMQLQKHHLFL